MDEGGHKVQTSNYKTSHEAIIYNVMTMVNIIIFVSY